MSWLRPTHSGNGPWVVALSCCGRDQGTQRCPTWQTADDFRESYVSAEGHDRSAIIVQGPDGLQCGQDEALKLYEQPI